MLHKEEFTKGICCSTFNFGYNSYKLVVFELSRYRGYYHLNRSAAVILNEQRGCSNYCYAYWIAMGIREWAGVGHAL